MISTFEKISFNIQPTELQELSTELKGAFPFNGGNAFSAVQNGDHKILECGDYVLREKKFFIAVTKEGTKIYFVFLDAAFSRLKRKETFLLEGDDFNIDN